MWDVGANVGAVALALAKYVGPSGKVYAFEPGPPNQQRFRNNFTLNPKLLAGRSCSNAASPTNPAISDES
jgi:FkbM family methyltransferase